ncbi:hypothetical protein F4808DRAFT_246838 [Astrocystis sublimbata]|nr:hypothetical protein F4808DRAFT_246838 [Astrocystis sublimbata]
MSSSTHKNDENAASSPNDNVLLTPTSPTMPSSFHEGAEDAAASLDGGTLLTPTSTTAPASIHGDIHEGIHEGDKGAGPSRNVGVQASPTASGPDRCLRAHVYEDSYEAEDRTTYDISEEGSRTVVPRTSRRRLHEELVRVIDASHFAGHPSSIEVTWSVAIHSQEEMPYGLRRRIMQVVGDASPKCSHTKNTVAFSSREGVQPERRDPPDGYQYFYPISRDGEITGEARLGRAVYGQKPNASPSSGDRGRNLFIEESPSWVSRRGVCETMTPGIQVYLGIP